MELRLKPCSILVPSLISSLRHCVANCPRSPSTPQRTSLLLMRQVPCAKVSFSFLGMSVPLDFLVIYGPPFDIIVGFPTLETLQACLDLGNQQVKIRIAGRKVTFGFDYASVGASDNDETDSDHFNSYLDAAFDESDSKDDEEFSVTLTDKCQSDNNHVIPEVDITDEDQHEELLWLKLFHEPEIEREKISSSLREANLIAWSLTDVRRADV